jgi:hypothetical protein
MRRLAIALLAALPALARAAPVAGDASLVPGRMGFNALPALIAADPEIGDDLAVEVSGLAQASDATDAADASVAPYLRVQLPFRRVAALEVDAIPFEAWRVGPATQQRLDAVRSSGLTKGDIRFSAQFALRGESPGFPALGLRVFTKTASGKGAEDRRFLAAPAYGADALVAKTLPWRLGPFAVRTVAAAGFLAWQQGSGHQDDAFTAAARVLLRSERHTRLAIDWRAYWGWQQNDKPMVIGATAGWRAWDAVELVGVVDRGLTGDAPPWALRLGFVLYLETRSLPGIGPTVSGAT